MDTTGKRNRGLDDPGGEDGSRLRIREISSPHNARLKEIRRALEGGKPTADGLVVIEGPHLLAEAQRSGVEIDSIVTTEDGRSRFARELDGVEAELVQVPPKVFEQISSTETAQEVMALVRMPAWTWPQLLRELTLLVVLDGLQDPGNAGAVVRSAEAFGATGVVFLLSSVRVANAKFLRASAGSIFRIPVVEQIGVETLKREAEAAGIRLYALTSGRVQSLTETDFRRNCALIVGNEGAGVHRDLLAIAQPISIRTRAVESLNAAVACSLALYEAHNQRTGNEFV